MRRSGKVLVLLVFLVIAGAICILYGPPSGSRTPYLSALSELTLGTPVLAAKCDHMRCGGVPGTCGSSPNHSRCVLLVGGGCTSDPC